MLVVKLTNRWLRSNLNWEIASHFHDATLPCLAIASPPSTDTYSPAR